MFPCIGPACQRGFIPIPVYCFEKRKGSIRIFLSENPVLYSFKNTIPKSAVRKSPCTEAEAYRMNVVL